jgi:hypothetical protein
VEARFAEANRNARVFFQGRIDTYASSQELWDLSDIARLPTWNPDVEV